MRETAVEKKQIACTMVKRPMRFSTETQRKLLAFSWLAYFAENTIVLPDWLSDRAWLSFIASATLRARSTTTDSTVNVTTPREPVTKIILTCFAELEVRGVLEGSPGRIWAFGPRGRGATGVPA